MPTGTRLFEWQGLTTDGERISGQYAASNKTELGEWLIGQEILLLSARRIASSRPLASREIVFLLRQFAMLLHAGLPLMEVFELIQRQAPRRLHGALARMRYDVEAGLSLSQSMEPQLRRKHRFIARIMRIGENSGRIAPLLNQLSVQRERHEKMLKRLKQAATYPLVVLVASFGVMALLMMTVVPQFESIYAGFGGTLPGYTQLTLRLSRLVAEHGALIAGAVTALSAGLVLLHRSAHWFRLAIAHALLRLPIVGALKKAYLRRLFATLVGVAYEAGVPIDKVLEWLPETTSDALFRKVIAEVSRQLETGEGFSDAIAHTGFFGHFFEQMVLIGERSGQLGDTLQRIAEYYDERLENGIDKAMRLMEPCLILLVAGIAGWIIAAMYLPIFNLGFAL